MAYKTQPTSLERRRFLDFSWRTVGAGIALSLLPGDSLFARKRFGKNPFTLGVASGDPTPDGIVLWTRLAPEPANPAAWGFHPIPVGWRVATDERMRRVVKRGVALAPAELAHSVHVEVEACSRAAIIFISSICTTRKAASATFARRRPSTT